MSFSDTVFRNDVFKDFEANFNTIQGVVAEWLGSGLQHHLQRFESARHLKKNCYIFDYQFFLFMIMM